MHDRWLYGWALGYAAVGAASLLIPLYALALDGGAVLVGLLASTAAFAGVPGALLWGKLVQRTHRRRPFILVALVATALVLLVVPAIDTSLPLLAVNAGLWFVVAAAAPVLNLIMVDGYPETEWESRIGRLNAYQGYGWVAGLVLGTAWTVLVPRVAPGIDVTRDLFFVLAGLAAAAAVVVRVWYPEPTAISDSYFREVYHDLSQMGLGSGRILRTVAYGPGRMYWGLVTLHPRQFRRLETPLWRYLLAASLFSIGFAVFWGPMPAYLTAEGFSTSTVFALFLAGNLGSAATYARVGHLTSRYGPGSVQTGALAARVVLFPLVGVVGSLTVGAPVIAACFALIGVTWAVIAVTTTGLVTRLADAAERGEALGLQAALIGIGTGLGSVVGGLLASELGYTLSFGAAGGVVLLGALLVVFNGAVVRARTTAPDSL